jgi:hypothetical protein
MAGIHDFKFIHPMLAEPLIVAEQVDRNDYLMTVALLTIASSYGRTRLLIIGHFYNVSLQKVQVHIPRYGREFSWFYLAR